MSGRVLRISLKASSKAGDLRSESNFHSEGSPVDPASRAAVPVEQEPLRPCFRVNVEPVHRPTVELVASSVVVRYQTRLEDSYGDVERDLA